MRAATAVVAGEAVAAAGAMGQKVVAAGRVDVEVEVAAGADLAAGSVEAAPAAIQCPLLMLLIASRHGSRPFMSPSRGRP